MRARVNTFPWPAAASFLHALCAPRPSASNPDPRTDVGGSRTRTRYVPKLVRLVWTTHPGYTVIMTVLRLVRAFVPVATLWIGKLIIDQVLPCARTHGSADPLWHLVAIEIAIVVGGELLARASALVESLLGDLFSNRIERPAHGARGDARPRAVRGSRVLRSPRARAAADGGTHRRCSRSCSAWGRTRSRSLTLGAALVVYSPWLLLLLVVAVLPSFLGETHFAALEYSLLFRWTPERRQLDYLRYVGASDETAKEVQMFGLAPWLIERYRVLADRFYEENKRLSIRKRRRRAARSRSSARSATTRRTCVILARTVDGAITIGTLTFLAASFARSRDLIQRLLLSASGIYEQSLYLKDLFDFFDMQPTIASRAGARAGAAADSATGSCSRTSASGIRAASGGRCATSTSRSRPGERIALVGENGAGQDDAHQAARAALRSDRRAHPARRRRPARVRPRVAAPRDRRDLPGLRALRHALRRERRRRRDRARCATISTQPNGDGARRRRPRRSSTRPRSRSPRRCCRDSPDGYRQMLGRRFEDGVDLSGGEWQKIALARAYMRDAQVLILDEPTAALDARAEYEVFVRFSELMAGRMAVLISHRFSTVRMADRIIVLQNGGIVEQGTHEELVAGGLYAELFAMQAAGYR